MYICVVSACPPGSYKSAQGNSVCLPCPSNSNSSVIGSSQCPCLHGYYRPADSGAGDGCIAEGKHLTAKLWQSKRMPCSKLWRFIVLLMLKKQNSSCEHVHVTMLAA